MERDGRMPNRHLFKICINKKSIIAFVVAVFITTNYMYHIVNPAIYLITLFLLLYGIRPGRVNFTTQSLLMMPFVVCIIIGGLFTPAGNSGRVYMVTTCFLLMMLLRSNVECSWIEYFPKHLMFLTGVQALFVLLYPFVPSFVQAVAKIVLSPESYATNTFQWNRYHIDCGITGVQSLAAFYVTIFLSVVYAIYFNSEKKDRKKKFVLIMYILAFVALLYTSKRGVMLANVVALLAIPLLLDKKISKKIQYLLILGIVAVIGYSFLSQYFPQAIRIFTRFQTQEDISTGRFDIYMLLLNNVRSDWLIGKGNLSAALILDGNYGHNIYIQLFYENGILGCLSFILFSLLTFVKTVLNYRNATKIKTKNFLLTSFYFQIYFLFYGLFGNPLFDYTIYFTYICMVIMGVYGEKLLKKEKMEKDAI